MNQPEILRTVLLDRAGPDRAGVSHGFTTRRGGVSPPPYDTLNLSPARGDDLGAVQENRERVRRVLGLRSLVFSTQIHGSDVHRVEAAEDGILQVGEADALITDRPGVGLVAQTADCTPVLLFDPDAPAVGAVHAGWRGAVRNVAGAAVRAMSEAFGTDPRRLRVAIGPAISRANYRVGPEVLEAFEETFGGLDGELVGPRDAEGGAPLDVGEAVRRQLVAAGAQPDRVERLAVCTFDDTRFFSSRRSGGGSFGGQGGIIGLRS